MFKIVISALFALGLSSVAFADDHQKPMKTKKTAAAKMKKEKAAKTPAHEMAPDSHATTTPAGEAPKKKATAPTANKLERLINTSDFKRGFPKPLFSSLMVPMDSIAKKLKLIGWREWVSLPGLGIDAIKVKVDSGAKTCALHATQIRYIEKNGEKWVSFVVTTQLEPRHGHRVRAPLVARRKVKSSLGHSTVRPVIRTEIKLGEDTWPVEVTLVNRDPMGFRMLLGRQALKGRFYIHPARSFIQSKERDEP